MEPRFSGHETFPLRYGWLYKSCNFLSNKGNFSSSNDRDVEAAVVELGVGKNMVSAMRYWSECCGAIEVKKGSANQNLTQLGEYLFLDGAAKDPYLEQKGSIWLLHFLLNFNEEELTAYRYFFNLTSLQQFDKDKLIQDLESDIPRLFDKEVKTGSLKKDIDCFLNTYCSKRVASSKVEKEINEDFFSSPLSELRLINELGKNTYVALLEERQDIPFQVFVYALHRFICETKLSMSASFDALLSDQNSPGKIFRLSERGLGMHLENAVKKYPKLLALEDSQGLRQVKLLRKYQLGHSFFEFLDDYYGESK